MIFNHIHHDIPKLARIDSSEGRRYSTPTGKAYPSVTSVTGLHGKAEFFAWRKRVGEEEANRVAARAAKRGTAIHSLCETYLLNEEVKPNVFDLETFGSLKPYLNRINNIHCLETQLYSDYLQVAGTVDCIAEYDGRLSVIDFKTSKRIKSRDDIHGYFMQTAAYAVMFEERTKIPVDTLVILMSVDDEPAQIFVENRDDWIGSFIELREDYAKIKGH
jgi:CRISPR/Cas system-associated exonuclease Cas4 (RecB family)